MPVSLRNRLIFGIFRPVSAYFAFRTKSPQILIALFNWWARQGSNLNAFSAPFTTTP